MTTEPILNNPALKLCIEFALALVDYRELLEEKKKFVIAKPLLGSGTSNGANSFEAQNAESKADCIHEFKNSAKEVAETQYRLTIGSCSNNYPNRDQMIQKREAIHAVWGNILRSVKNNLKAGIKNKEIVMFLNKRFIKQNNAT